jgi:hypothetical protein
MELMAQTALLALRAQAEHLAQLELQVQQELQGLQAQVAPLVLQVQVEHLVLGVLPALQVQVEQQAQVEQQVQAEHQVLVVLQALALIL